MPGCCVPFCHSHTTKRAEKLSFHEFPSDVELCNIWLKVISRENFLPNSVSKSSVVCSKHFKDDDFKVTCRQRVLKRGAVPSIFPGYPSYLIPIQNHYQELAKQVIQENSGANRDTSKTFHLKNIELSSYQFGLIVDFMTLNPELISGKLTSSFTKSHKKDKWEELTSLLNSDGLGTKNEPWEWEMCWSNLKCYIKLKASKVQEHQERTSEVLDFSANFSELEEKVLKMISSIETESSENENEFEAETLPTIEISGIQVVKEKDQESLMNDSAMSAPVSENIEYVASSGTCPFSNVVPIDSLEDTAERSNRLNISEKNSSRLVAKRKKMHQPSFKAKKTTLIEQIQRQNVLLEKVAGAVERIEKVIENFNNSSHLMFEKSRALENIAASMEQSATTLNVIKKFY